MGNSKIDGKEPSNQDEIIIDLCATLEDILKTRNEPLSAETFHLTVRRAFLSLRKGKIAVNRDSDGPADTIRGEA